MKISTTLLLLFVLLIAPSCVFLSKNQFGDGLLTMERDSFDWQQKSAVDFLLLLVEMGPGTSYMVFELQDNWVKEADLPYLISVIDSDEPCASVTRSISSYMEPHGSTVGDEAAFLILGFQRGVYPPGLNSTRPGVCGEDKMRMKLRWRGY